VKITRGFTRSAPGSVLIETGQTRVLCTACLEAGVPRWREADGRGWLTAEYDMLPGSTQSRRARNRGKVDGRTQEIQRLIGRCLRSVIDLRALGANSILVDCDVLQADGGTRTASITGAFVAVVDALRDGRRRGLLTSSCIGEHVAAVSVGLVGGRVLVDLDYAEDVAAEVDLNLAMTASGRLVEIQGTGEETTFSRSDLNTMVGAAASGIRRLVACQRRALRARRVP
jgi:ribonuclease PH